MRNLKINEREELIINGRNNDMVNAVLMLSPYDYEELYKRSYISSKISKDFKELTLDDSFEISAYANIDSSNNITANISVWLGSSNFYDYDDNVFITDTEKNILYKEFDRVSRIQSGASIENLVTFLIKEAS